MSDVAGSCLGECVKPVLGEDCIGEPPVRRIRQWQLSPLTMLLLAKFISPTDPKWLSTLDELSKTLVSDSLVYRYDPEASPDGLRGQEGTFTVSRR